MTQTTATPYHVEAIKAFNDNYIWMITHPDSTSCVLVDPGDGDSACRAVKERQLTLAAILVTHHHQDHIGGIKQLRHSVSLTPDFAVYGPSKEAQQVVDQPLVEGDEVEIPQLSLNLKVLDIPGHTLGHIAYVDQQVLFCGDTLFAGGCGRVFEGTPAQMFNSLKKLSTLPANTLVYCAHEYTLANLKFAREVEPQSQALEQRFDDCMGLRQQQRATVPSTIALERATNPFLRVDQAEVINSARRYHLAPLQSETEVFTALRAWKDRF